MLFIAFSGGNLTAVKVTEPSLLQKAQSETKIPFDPVETTLLVNKFNLFATNSYMFRIFTTSKGICSEAELC